MMMGGTIDLPTCASCVWWIMAAIMSVIGIAWCLIK